MDGARAQARGAGRDGVADRRGPYYVAAPPQVPGGAPAATTPGVLTIVFGLIAHHQRALGLIAVLAIVVAGHLPPTAAQERRVAQRLAAQAGCPREMPRMVAETPTGLTDLELCGVLSAGIARVAARHSDPPAHLRTDTTAYAASYVSGFRETTIVHDDCDAAGCDTRSWGVRWDPPPPRARRVLGGAASYWTFIVSGRARGTAVLDLVYVDRWTGTAHAAVVGR